MNKEERLMQLCKVLNHVRGGSDLRIYPQEREMDKDFERYKSLFREEDDKNQGFEARGINTLYRFLEELIT